MAVPQRERQAGIRDSLSLGYAFTESGWQAPRTRLRPVMSDLVARPVQRVAFDIEPCTRIAPRGRARPGSGTS